MALNLGFTPQYRPHEQLFVSCGRQSPSEAASIVGQINRQIPVFYDDGRQSGIPEKMANSRAVVFFADSKLFSGEDADMCKELTVARTLEKNCICVWCEDMSNFDVRKLSDSMYNLWLGLKNMTSVNAYDKASVGEAAAAVISASGAAVQSALQDSDFPDITASGAALKYDDDSFNSLGTDLFESTSPQTAPIFNPTPVQNAAPSTPVRVVSETMVQAQPKRKSSPVITVIIIIVLLLLIGICAWLFMMRGKPINIDSLFNFNATEDTDDNLKPEYVADIESTKQVNVNDEVKFGNFEGKEIEWIILDKDGDKLLLLSKNVLTEKPFDDEYSGNITDEQWQKIDEEHKTITTLSENPHNYIEEYKFGVNWENSSLRQWLNGEFINSSFTADEQNKIDKTYTYTPNVTVKPLNESVNKFRDYIISCGEDEMNKVFLLSADECDAYFPTLSDRITDKNWWLRSNGYGFGRWEAVVNGVQTNLDRVDDERIQIVDESGKPSILEGSHNESNGTYYYCYLGEFVYKQCGVRPAMWVKVG